MNLEALIQVHCRNWTKNEGIRIQVVDLCTFAFYFEDQDEMELVLKKTPS